MTKLGNLKAQAIKEGWAEWIQTPNDEAALLEGCYFDLTAAQHVKDFFSKYLRHSTGKWAGRPFHLLPFQFEKIIAPLFGWKNRDGKRRFRRAYVSMAKKNGKTTLGAGIILYMLLEEPSAECYSVATTRDQAAYVYRECAKMVKASPQLRSILKPINSTKSVTFEDTLSFYRALSSEANSAEGLNANLILYDELHAAKTRDLFDAVRYAGAAREQPLFISITTAGFDKHSICFEQYDYAKKVADGLEDISFFSYIAEADKEDDWKNEDNTWKKANPSWGVTIDPTQFEQDFLEAEKSPTKEASFRRYRLNQWTASESPFLKMERWDGCEYDREDLTGCECFGGLDLSSRVDITSFVLLFPIYDGEKLLRFDVLPTFWIPEETAKEKEKDGVPYLTWINQGYIDTTPGNVVDQSFIRKRINDLGEQYHIKEIAVDDWNAQKIMTELDGDGFRIMNFRQGFRSMSEPTKDLEAIVLDRKLNHYGNPVLRWMAQNTVIETDAAGNIKPSKKKSKNKIDGMVALIMALGSANLDKESGSVYDSHGVEYF